jgi:outer membrane cobalamin receptor
MASALALVAASLVTAAPGAISGVVLDEARQPLAGAQVWQADGPIGTAADAGGRYVLGIPLPGTYRIVYQYIGFVPETLSVAVGSGEQVSRNVTLRQTRIAVPAVESRASAERVHESRTPEPTTVIPKAAAEKAGKMTIGEAATLETGVQLQKRCGACEASEVSIHGLPGRFSLILLDGTPLFSNLASRYILDMLPVDFLDRLEVLKGASGAIWGSDAIAGAVNILPYQAARPLEARASYTRHSFGNDVSALVGTNQSPFGASLIGAFGNRSPVDQNRDGIAENTSYRRGLMLGNAYFAPGARWLFGVGGAFGDEERRGGAIIPDAEYATNPLAEKVHTRRWDLWQRTGFTADDKELQLRFAFSHYGEDGVVETRDHAAGQTTGYAELTFGLPHVTTGLSYSGQSLSDSRLFSAGYAERTIAGWVAGRNLTFSVAGIPADVLPALRLDHNSDYGFIISPFAALKLYPPLVDVSLAAGTGFRTPTVIMESMENLPGGYQYAIRRDSALTRESGFSVVGGLGRKLAGPDLVTELRLNLFYHRVGNFISADLVGLDTVTRRAIFYYRNQDEVTTSTGAEFSASFTVPRGITANLGAYLVRPQSGPGEYLPFVRRWGASTSLAVPYQPWGLEFVAIGDLNGPMLVRAVMDDGTVDEYSSPVYPVVSLRATKSLGIFRIGAGASNLFDYQQPPLSHHGGKTDYYWGPIIGREFSVTISASI